MTAHRDVVIPSADAYVLRRARVPACFLERLPDGATADGEHCAVVDLAIAGGRIAAIYAAGSAPADQPSVDLEARQVWATLLDMHAHLDKGQVIPRVEPDGTLDSGAIRTARDRKRWTHADMAARMGFGLRCAYVHGVSAIRTHLDSQEESAPTSWEVFRALRAEWAGRVELQAVGLMSLAGFRAPWGAALADLVARSQGILGGTTDAIGEYEGAVNAELDSLLDLFLAMAAERGLDVDLHVDQSEDVKAFALPSIARAVLRNRFKGRVVVDHCVNLALQPEAVIAETIALCREAGLCFVTLPTPMMYLQDRKPGRTPRWRGVTLAQELDAAGVPIAIGGDNCRDAWFPFGDHDMVDSFQQAVRVFQLDAPIARAVAMAGPVPASIIGLPQHGRIAVDGPARLILFAARTLNELMCRPQSDRIVIDRGRRVSDPLPEYAELDPIMA